MATRKPRGPQTAPKLTKRKVIAAIQAAGGGMYLAARTLGVVPSTIYRWRDRCPEVAKAIADCDEEVNDIAESALKRAIINGEGWAVCFRLKCKAKHRGYVERQEVTGANGERIAPITINVVRGPQP